MPSMSGSRSRCTPSRRDVAADAAVAGADLVDLVEEDDAVVLHRADRLLHQLLLVEQLVRLLLEQEIVGGLHRDLARLGAAAAERLAEHLADIHHADRGARHSRHVEGAHRIGGVAHLDLDLLVVELAGDEPLAEALARRRAGMLADQRVEHALLGLPMRLRLHVPTLLVAHQEDARLDEVADHLLDVAADIADLGEFRRLHLDEGRIRELGEAAGDLRLADAGRADHQDVLGQHLLAHRAAKLLAAPAVAERDRDGALGVLLADDVAVEFGDGLARREGGVAAGLRFVFGLHGIVSGRHRAPPRSRLTLV